MTPVSRFTLKAALALAIVAGLIAPSPAPAQTLYGSIIGTVSDQQAAAIPGATITASNPSTGFSVNAVTDATGGYAFRNLLPGTYDLRASLEGFRELNQTGLRVSAGSAIRLDLKLEVGALAETVNVVSETTLLQTERADLSFEVSSKEIVNLPLNSFRNYQALINLVPGSTPAQFQNAEIDTPGRALRTSVNGMQENSNAFRIDGAVSVNLWLPHHVGYVNPAETIDTVSISTNNFDADQGMAAGAAVTVVTKSGTNALRGSAFFFRAQDEFNANTFNNNANGLPKNDLSNNIFGGTLGGPIVKDKLFFFGSWERYQGRRGVQQNLTVPTAAMRAGNFSEVGAGGYNFTLYNPFTGGAGGAGRTPFPGNQIPANLISPTATAILAQWPLPNTGTDINRNGIADDYTRAVNVTNDRDNFDVKLTWQRTGSHSIWGKFGMLDAEVVDNFILGFDQGSIGDTRTYVGTVGHTWTLSPSLVLDGNFGLNRMEQTVTGPDYGTNFGLNFGIPGTNGPSERYSGVPYIGAGYEFGTTPNWMPLFRTEQSFTFSSALTKIFARHEVRVGIDVVKHELNHFQAEFGGAGGVRGNLTSQNAITSAPGYVPLQWNGFGGFLLGLQSFHGKDVQELEMTAREWQMAAYIRDRWQIGQKLTLSLGLRLEHYPLMTRANDKGIERLDYNTYTILMGGYGSTPEGRGYQHQGVVPRPAPRRHVPPQREHGAPRRLRPHHQPAALVAPAPRLLPLRHLLQQHRRAVRVAGHAARRHPAGRGARPQQRRGPPPAQHLHALAQPGRRGPGRAPAGERGRRAAPARQPRRRGGLRPRTLGRRLRRPGPQLRPAGRRQREPAVLQRRRHHRHRRLGGPHQAALQRPAGGPQPAVPQRPAPQGRLHAQRGEERDGRGRLGRPHLEPPGPSRAGTSPSPARTGRTCSRWASSTSCPSRGTGRACSPRS